MKKKILYVEDEIAVADSFRDLLEREGFEVFLAKNLKAALKGYNLFTPDLVLLDVMLGKELGYSICEQLRAVDPSIPILFLTNADSELHQLRGFNVGADDYILKVRAAEHPQLFIAKLHAAMDRVSRIRTQEAQSASAFLIGNVEVDTDLKTIKGPGIDEVMTGTEADILSILHLAGEQLVPYAEIMRNLRGSTLADSSMLHVHISHLRKKLGPIAGRKLQNLTSRGYILCK